jgi:hypothetical protein
MTIKYVADHSAKSIQIGAIHTKIFWVSTKLTNNALSHDVEDAAFPLIRCGVADGHLLSSSSVLIYRSVSLRGGLA